MVDHDDKSGFLAFLSYFYKKTYIVFLVVLFFWNDGELSSIEYVLVIN
jgi:hypothetical protein